MATIDIHNLSGAKVGTLELADEVFGAVNEDLLWEAVKHYRAAQHAGTHATKNRWRVSGSGKKLWKQKGTGRARDSASLLPRAGDRKSTRLNSSHLVISYAVHLYLHSFPTRRSSDLTGRRSLWRGERGPALGSSEALSGCAARGNARHQESLAGFGLRQKAMEAEGHRARAR